MNTFHKVYKLTRIWILLAIAIILPLILSNKYYLHVANLAMMFAILTLSLNVLGSTGLMSVGHIAFYGIGAYTSALLTAKLGCPIIHKRSEETLRRIREAEEKQKEEKERKRASQGRQSQQR